MIFELEDPIGYEEEVIEDDTIDELINEISTIEHRQFLSHLEETYNEIIDLRINKIRTEHLHVSTESYEELIKRVLTMLKNFAIVVGKSLMFWKKKFVAFMEDKSEELGLLCELADAALNSHDDPNEEKYNNIHGTIHYPSYEGELDISKQFDEIAINIENLIGVKDNIVKYIKDPELNNRKMILELEEDENPRTSFKILLGVHINSNHENPLVPSRIRVDPLNTIYNTFTFNEDQPFQAFIPYDDAGHCLSTVKGRADALRRMFLDNGNITNIMRGIEKSYNDLERGTRLSFFDKNSAEANADIAKVEALVKARDHIAKSKALLDRLAQVMNIQFLNMKFIIHSIASTIESLTKE